MNRYVLFLLTDILSDDCKGKVQEFVKTVLQTEVAKTHRLCETSKVFASFVSLAADQENGNIGSSVVAAWKLVETDWQEKLGCLNSFFLESCTYSNIPDLVQALHSLCDTLRRPGSLVELFWFRSDCYEVCDDDIELYGCAKKLQLWHNAIISIIVPVDFDSSHGACPHHFDSLRPTILPLDQALLQYQCPVWIGSIAVSGSTQLIQLPGFRLDALATEECLEVASPMNERLEMAAVSEVILSSCMKFVASVDVRDVPLFYISSTCYRLSLTSRSAVLQKSDNFLSLLRESENVGYIIRIEYGFCPDETDRGRESKIRRSWSDFLKEHYNNGCDDFASSEEFDFVVGSHSFLVCASSSEELHFHRPNQSKQEFEEFSILAYRLRNSSELNGSPMHQLTLRTLEKDTNEEDILGLIDRLSRKGPSVAAFLENLPHFSTKAFGKLLNNLRHAQLIAVQKLAGQGETGVLSAEELIQVLLKVRTAFFENVMSKHSLKEHRPLSIATSCLQSTLMPEYRLDPYLQPERQILMLKASDSVSAQSKSFQHCGTLATLSPPTNSLVAVTLDATEMLKYFNPDGTAVASDSFVKVPVKKKRQRLFRYDRGEARTLPWPECAQARYHDVYYNVGVSDDLEQKCQQLRARLGVREMSSTFSTSQTFLLPAKAGNDRQKLSSFPSRQKMLDRRNSVPANKTKIQNCTKLESSLSSCQTSTESKASLRGSESLIDSSSCDSNSNSEFRRGSRSERNRRKLEEVIVETLETTNSIGPSDPLFKPCFKRLYTITETFVRDLPTSRCLRENMMQIARSHVKQTVKFEKDRQWSLLENGRNA